MEQLTELGKKMIATDNEKIRMDQSVKSILAYKPLLARIFKEVVVECRDMDYDEIEACIEGKVLISEVYVDSGLTNAGELIDGQNTEAYLNGEGLDRYDIRTYLMIPGNGAKQYVKLLINVESQNEDKPGYDIPLRALFYCCRMISAQQGVEFTTAADDPVKYGSIKKVYSIWVCTDAAQKRANSIESYAINRELLVGSNTDDPRYDIMNAVIIYLSGKYDTENTDNELIKVLTELFDNRVPGVNKISRLKEYGVNLTRELEGEVTGMCTYAESVERKGIEKGIEKGREEGLQALIFSLSGFIKDFDSLYSAVTQNDVYKDVTREVVLKYYNH